MTSWEFGDAYMQFTYNADGMRTKATCNDDVYEYVYNGSQLVNVDEDRVEVVGLMMLFGYDGLAEFTWR